MRPVGLLLLLALLGGSTVVFNLRGQTSVAQFHQIYNEIQHNLPTMDRLRTLVNNEEIDNPIPICFLVSIYGKWAGTVDKVFPVEKLPFYESPYYNFFGFTNLPRWERPGWTRIVRNFPEFRRFITQSRWPKFQGWKDEQIQANCSVVFYMDSITEITGSSKQFQKLARQVVESDVGFAQYQHPGGGGAFAEFRRIAKVGKDRLSNIEASKEWLRNRSDFSPNCTLYENRYIAYSVNSTNFRKATDFFWDRYSKEVDSWRDQPLWCYVLEHFNLTPVPLEHRKLFRMTHRRMGKNKHKYGADSEYGVEDRMKSIKNQLKRKKKQQKS
ncbi:unnamed protein product [Cylindrotheca closterium]|uniref:Cyanocobalamin reductase (cyanide-eliminating) n=1 Tax=Cylindrotheca closterium TaxID=2856 RepID=A0AAD2G9A1_9STRA|nr:unnamed protein product [Cylindrotheca closterium]